ncbi:MAG: hypothetical protein ACRBK7_01035 [Acidimicrobiales bacterium]
MFENLVISETAYDLLFQESEPVYVFEQGVFGDDRTQDHDKNTGYPLWMIRVTASDETNREEQVIEVQVAAPEQPEAGFKKPVLLPNLRVQMYSRKTEKNITARWYADAFAPATGNTPKPASRKEAENGKTPVSAAA